MAPMPPACPMAIDRLAGQAPAIGASRTGIRRLNRAQNVRARSAASRAMSALLQRFEPVLRECLEQIGRIEDVDRRELFGVWKRGGQVAVDIVERCDTHV